MPRQPLDLPRPLGDYSLLRRLAVGGMAEVYQASAPGIGGFEKLVAIKVIHPRYSEDDHFVRLLVDEAKITVQLNHANIAQIFDLGRIENTFFIVMEFIDGVDVFRLMRQAHSRKLRLSPELGAYIMAQVCGGLDYAHRKRGRDGEPLNVVHRDVSPQNVLLSRAGEVKLVDFGIAKAKGRTSETEAGVIKGKYYYMSPEQAWGDPVDARSDVFSAGIVLHELLTGRMVYREQNLPKLLDRVRKANIRPPSLKRSGLPPTLDKIVMRAVAKRPGDRFQSAHHMAQALTDFLYEAAPTFTASRLADVLATLVPRLPAGEARPRDRITKKAPMTGHADTMAAMRGEEFIPDRARSVVYGATRSATPASLGSSHADSDCPPTVAEGRPASAKTQVPTNVGSDTTNDADDGFDVATIADTSGRHLFLTPDQDPEDNSPTERPDATTSRREPAEETRPAGPGYLPPPAPIPDSNLPETHSPIAASSSIIPDPFSPQSAAPSAAPVVKRAAPRPLNIIKITAIGMLACLMGYGLVNVFSPSSDTPGMSLYLVTVPPGATVSVDGTRLSGTTPMTIAADPLAPERAIALEVNLLGYERWGFTYDPTTESGRHVAVLSPRRGQATIESIPSGAGVTIDGQPIGDTPLVVPDLPVGRRLRVQLNHAGYRTHQQDLVISTTNLNPRMDITLQPVVPRESPSEP